jgi:Na+/proline symporter
VVGLSSHASRGELEPAVDRPARWIVRNGCALWAAIVLIVSVVPVGWVFGFAESDDWSWMAALGHFAEFGIFTALVAVAWSQSRRRGWTEGLLVGVAAGVGYGLLIEAVQFPLPYRSADLRDFALDVCGVATVALLLTWARRRQERRRGRRG